VLTRHVTHWESK